MFTSGKRRLRLFEVVFEHRGETCQCILPQIRLHIINSTIFTLINQESSKENGQYMIYFYLRQIDLN